MGIPWSKINDFLAEAGAVENIEQFAERTLENVYRIIPYDANTMFVHADELGRVRSWRTIVDSEKWLPPFNNYYYRVMPEVAGRDIVAVDWRKYHNQEYACDFIEPQGVRYTIGLFRLGYKVNRAVVLTAHRSKSSRQFNETEQMVCRIIQPHLANLFNIISKINNQENNAYYLAELAGDCKLLSKREAEVAILLCQRLTAPEIATKLMISPRTVEFHMANIYQKLKARNRKELLLKLKEGK